MSPFQNGTNCRLGRIVAFWNLGRIVAWDELSLGTNCRFTVSKNRITSFQCCYSQYVWYLIHLKRLAYMLYSSVASLPSPSSNIEAWPNDTSLPSVRNHGTLAMIMVNLANSWLTMVPLSRSWQIMIRGTLVKIMARSWQDLDKITMVKTCKLVLIVHNLFFSQKFLVVCNF